VLELYPCLSYRQVPFKIASQGKVCGYVRNIETGLPIEDAMVIIELSGQSSYTNVDGYYEIIEPQFSGESNITASCSDYLSQIGTFFYDSANPTEKNIDFSLTPISGWTSFRNSPQSAGSRPRRKWDVMARRYAPNSVSVYLESFTPGPFTTSSEVQLDSGATELAGRKIKVDVTQGSFSGSFEVEFNDMLSSYSKIGQLDTDNISVDTNIIIGMFYSGIGEIRLAGRVTDVNTGNPISGVSVNMNGMSTTTTTNGDYSFKNFSPGIYTLTFRKDGYDVRQDTITINQYEDRQLDVTLITESGPPAGVTAIWGYIKDADTGNPIINAEIEFAGVTTVSKLPGGYYELLNVPLVSALLNCSVGYYDDYSVGVAPIDGQALRHDIAMNSTFFGRR